MAKPVLPGLPAVALAITILGVVASWVIQSSMHGPLPLAAQTEPFSEDGAIRDRDIAFFERRVMADTMGAADLAQLASLYLQRAREAGDVADYGRAEDASLRSLGLRSNRNDRALLVHASSLLALHRFPEALAAATRLCEGSGRPSHCALLGEIQLEMGDYPAAHATFDALSLHRASLGVAPRIARWLEVAGRTPEAIDLLRGVRDAAMERTDLPREQVAWFHLRAGDIALRNGRLEEAERAFRQGLEVEPADVRLLAGMARLSAVRGHWRRAIRFGSATGDRADIATLALIGDAHLALGEPDQAERYYRRAEEAAAENPEPFNRQWTMFRLDHDREIPATLALLRDEIAIRQDVYGWDQLAWALHRAGDYELAHQAMQQALRMGTRDAMLFFHAGVIERGLGNDSEAARHLRAALDINAHFHPTFPRWATAVLDSVKAGL